LCRQLRATQGWDSAPVKTTPMQHGEKEKGLGSGRAPKYSWYDKVMLFESLFQLGHISMLIKMKIIALKEKFQCFLLVIQS